MAALFTWNATHCARKPLYYYTLIRLFRQINPIIGKGWKIDPAVKAAPGLLVSRRVEPEESLVLPKGNNARE
jgi:hypothetical protein